MLNEAENAVFSCARVTDQLKFLRLVKLDMRKAIYSVSNSSTHEFDKCLRITQERGAGKYAYPDRPLYTTKCEDENIRVISLSPSDYSSDLFDDEISVLIDKYGKRNKKIPYESPNERSVVILLQCGSHNILLGSDLEVSEDSRVGWQAIIKDSQVIKENGKSSYFKIPHHGSNNGFHSDIWDKLLTNKPVGTITPWNRNTKLPKPEMIAKYSDLTNGLYQTSKLPTSEKPKRRKNKVKKVIDSFNNTLREIPFNYGVVSAKMDLQDTSDWKIELEGSAFKI